jgi:nucleoside-diphosphate-sugar epimerase
MSSLTVHGLGGHKYDDENAPREVKWNAYAESKIIAEDLVFEWAAKDTSKSSAVIRPGFIIYGPYDTHTYIQALEQIAKGRFAYINGGRKLISHVYVENLCYGINQLIKAKKIDGAYNILDGNLTWREWKKKWEKAINRKVRAICIPYFILVPPVAFLVGLYKLFGIKKSPPLNFYRIKVMRKDLAYLNDKMKMDVGYSPPFSFDEGISRTLDFFYQ